MDHYQLSWQLKCITKWALQVDSNTKFFHALASGRRNQNSIWSLEDSDGNCVEDEAALKELGKAHFSSIFKDDGSTCLVH